MDADFFEESPEKKQSESAFSAFTLAPGASADVSVPISRQVISDKV